MFKGLSNFAKSDNGMWFFVIIVVLFVIWALMSYSNTKMSITDGNTGYTGAPEHPVAGPEHILQPQMSNNTTVNPGAYVSQATANPADLLPPDHNNAWSALNPVNNGSPNMPDLLQAGNLIGLDTIGQTMKNANLQLRSDPIIVKQDVGPWNQSTYEADLGRVPLELGAGGR